MGRPARTYTETELQTAMYELAFRQGVAAPTSRALKEQGITISPQKLLELKETHPDKYERARETLHVRLGDQAEELANTYAAIERKLAARLEAEVPNLEARDLANATKNLATARGISLNNANILRGRPTEITETRDLDAIMRAIASKIPTVEGTADEITDALPAGNEKDPQPES